LELQAFREKQIDLELQKESQHVNEQMLAARQKKLERDEWESKEALEQRLEHVRKREEECTRREAELRVYRKIATFTGICPFYRNVDTNVGCKRLTFLPDGT